MSFKGKPSLALLFSVSIVWSVSCSKWLHEDPPQSTSIELNKDKTRCLKNWSEIMDKYLLGKSSRPEIEDFWNCLDSVVWHFQKNAIGDVPGIYSISELKRFVEEFFLKREIPQSFMERFKDLKRAIFSGDRENFNQEDLARIHLMLGEFKYGTSKMLPHITYLNFTSPTDAGLDGAILDLEQVAQHWMKNISSIHQSYKLEELLRFWSEFKQLLGIKAFEIAESKWENILKAAKLVKSLILGAPGDEILQSDWPLVYQRGTDAYIISLLYHFRLKGKPWHVGAAVTALKKASELIMRGLKESTKRHPQERISSKEIIELAQIVKNNGWINTENIRISSLQTALINLLRSVFYNPKLPVQSDEAFLTATGMEFVEQELAQWVTVQTEINGVFGNNEMLTAQEFKDRWRATDAARSEFSEIMRGTPYLTGLNRGQQILFSKDKKDREWVESNTLSHLNWMSRVTRAILKGYGSIEGGVTEANFDRFYREFRDFGIDLGLLDPASSDSGLRTHLEANTFTDAANGDGKISKLETVQELQILLSGGVGAGQIVENVLKMCAAKNQICSAQGRKGLRIEAVAVEQYLESSFAKAFANLPEMVVEFKNFSIAERQQFVRMLVRESQKELVDGWLNISQIRHIVGLMHFAESIVLRYDMNRSGKIDAIEVRSAFSVFQSFLEQAIWKTKREKVDPEDLFIGFVYFLKYGESLVPGGFWSKIRTAVRYYGMQYDITKNNLELNRAEIVRAMILFRNFAAGS